MKLKTVKELGNYTDAEMSIYEKIKKTRTERNVKDMVMRLYDVPLFLVLFLGSIAISFVLSLFFILSVLQEYVFISLPVSITESIFLLSGLFILQMLPIFIFYLILFAFALTKQYAKKEIEIEKEIYKQE